MTLDRDAALLAEEVLASCLPRRWVHVQAVALKAEAVAASFSTEDADALVAAAWLHDIGYAPALAQSGLHALDGARWLRARGFNERISALVANHSCAVFEADERGLGKELRAQFVDEPTPVRDVLWWADMTTGPDGQGMSVQERLAEVRARYGPDHIVTRFWAKAEVALVEAVSRAEAYLARTQPM